MELSKSSVTIRRVFGAILLLPVIFVVWYDQIIGGLMVVILALFMSVEAKRIINMPPIIGYLVVFLIMAQSIPQWLIDRPVAVHLWGCVIGGHHGAVSYKKKYCGTVFWFAFALLWLCHFVAIATVWPYHACRAGCDYCRMR